MKTLRYSLPLVLTASLLACSGGPEPALIAPTSPPPQPPPPPPTGSASAAAPVPRPAPRENAKLIPRTTLFGNPDRSMPKVSPDGKQIAFLAPDAGVLNVWVAPLSNPSAAKPVTQERKRGLSNYYWAYSGSQILFTQDKGGDENFHVYLADTAGGEVRDLTPMDGIRAQIEEVSPKLKDSILIGINKRDPKAHDLYRADLKTGKLTVVAENKEGFTGFVTDGDYNARLAIKMLPDGGEEILKPDPKAKGAWITYTKIPAEDVLTTQPAGFDKAGKLLYMIDSRGRDTAALVAIDFKTDKQTVLFENPRADVNDVLVHPTERRAQAVASTRERAKWHLIDKDLEPDFGALRDVANGDFQVMSRSLDDKVWIVSYLLDDGPVRYYLYDRPSKKAEFLFSNRKALEGLAARQDAPGDDQGPRRARARQLSLAARRQSDPDADGKPDKPLPMVLLVHGGPWARDSWGLNSDPPVAGQPRLRGALRQLPGSTGFGKKFVNAGDKEWAGKMHDDLLDAVDWAVEQRIADPRPRSRSWAAATAATPRWSASRSRPTSFACGVDIVGPVEPGHAARVDPALLEADARDLHPARRRPDDGGGQEAARERSPLARVDADQAPAAHRAGRQRPARQAGRVRSDRRGDARRRRSRSPTSLYPDEGHGFARPENRMSFNAVTEIFLAQCLGGRYQPIGDDFKGSTIKVPAGADHIPGLADVLAKNERSEHVAITFASRRSP